MAYPPPVLPTNRTNATPQQDVHPADHNAVNGAVNDIVTQVNFQTTRIDDLANQTATLRARKPIIYTANNSAGIATAAATWTSYQCGTFTLPAGFVYDLLLTVATGINSPSGGGVHIIGGLNGQQAATIASGCVTAAGTTVHLVNSWGTTLGAGTYNIHVFGLTPVAGTMGNTWVSMIAVAR